MREREEGREGGRKKGREGGRQKEQEGMERKNGRKEVLTLNISQTETHYLPSSPPKIPILMTPLRSPRILGLLPSPLSFTLYIQ